MKTKVEKNDESSSSSGEEITDNNEDIQTATNSNCIENNLKREVKGVSDPPKRRGRPRKNQEKTKFVEPKKLKVGAIKKSNDEDIILHLPIYDDDEENSSEKNMFTMKNDTETQLSHATKISSKMAAILSISDGANTNSDSDPEMSIQQLIAELKKKDLMIKKLRDTVSDLKNANYDVNVSATKEYKSSYIDIRLINIKDNKSIVVEKTDIACWWDSHTFDSVPCFIPDRYYNNKYYVFGCFCSFNCALAYNLNMVNDYRAQIRHSLIRKLYHSIFGCNDDIPVSPQKELLKKFGGPLTIEEFRNKSILIKKEYKIILPPLVPLLPMIEESSRDTGSIIVPSKVQQYKKPGKVIKEPEVSA